MSLANTPHGHTTKFRENPTKSERNPNFPKFLGGEHGQPGSYGVAGPLQCRISPDFSRYLVICPDIPYRGKKPGLKIVGGNY